MITKDKITEIFCATDEFSKKFDEEIENMPLLSPDGKAPDFVNDSPVFTPALGLTV